MTKEAIGYLSRRVVFSAAHRLHSSDLSDAENLKIFGKCNHLNGHGHNYELEVVLRGSINAATGLIYNLSDLKVVIERVVLSRVDHRHLNLDVPEFAKLNPTAEVIARVFWDWLKPELPKGLLYEVRLRETENNLAMYRGE